MIGLETGQARIFVRPGPTDMRKQINGLAVVAEQAMGVNPFDSALFVFCNGERRILPDDRPVEHAEALRRELECFVAACRGEANRGVGGPEARRALASALEVARAAAPAAAPC